MKTYLPGAGSALNVAMRGTGLVLRFVLVFYLARYLGLEQSGLYAVLAGVIGFASPVFGLGLHYYINREIVSLDIFNAGVAIKERELITLSISLVGAALAGLVAIYALGANADVVECCIPIAVLEVVIGDFQLCLISLGRPLVANAVLFVKGALWIGPFVVLGLMFPSCRTLIFLFICWISGLVLACALVLTQFWSWPWQDILREKIVISKLTDEIRRVWLIYLGDIAVTSMLYMDRFLVGAFLGLQATAIYTFFFQMGNAVQLLSMTGFVQPRLPSLVRAYMLSSQKWVEEVISLAFSVSAFGGILFVIVHFGLAESLIFLHRPAVQEKFYLFPIFCLGFAIRSLSDVANYALYSRRLDKWLGVVNLLGVGISALALAVAIKIWGLDGAPWAIVASGLVVLVTRSWVAIGDVRRVSAGGSKRRATSV